VYALLLAASLLPPAVYAGNDVLGAAGLTRAFSVIGNVLILVLAVGIAWPVRYHLLHNWQALGILIVTAVELLFALRG